MLDNRLDKDLIPDPSLYTMLIRAGRSAVDVVIYSPMVDNSLIYRSFPRAVDDTSTTLPLEEAVYDNPLMLADFRHTVIVTDTTAWTLCPAELAEEDAGACERVFAAFYPKWEGQTVTAPTGMADATIVYGIDSRLAGFVGRTFPSVTVEPHILPLMRYFAARPGRGNSPRMLVNLRRGDADIIVAEGNSLRQAVTVAFNTTADLAYHVLSSVQAAGMNAGSDELLLAGDREVREELTPILRTYHARVMPVIFPPEMFRAGREAMNTPFDLIVAPLT